MNKKLLAIAIGAALAAPVYVAQADVKIGGQAHVSADYVDTVTNTTTNDQAKYWNISSNVSNIFVKAEEDLGGGMKGIFFLQEYFRLDDNGGNSTVAGSTNRMHDAPAYAGLGGGFGTVLMGNMDGPAKLVGRAVDLFNNQIGDSRNAGAENTRLQNSIAYISPTMAGFTVTLAHSTNLDNGFVTPSGAAQNYGTEIGAKYESGPVMVGAAYMMVDNRTSTAVAYDTATVYNLGASFKFGGARIVGFYQGATAVGNVPGTDADTYGIGASYTFGGTETIKAQWYNLTRKANNLADISSSVYAIGYDHAFSKTFTGYAAIAFASNDTGSASTAVANNAVAMAGGGGHGDSPLNYNGGDQNGLSLGIIYNF